ncbi:MAG: hypothetical protein AABZ12_14025 [Planctomycetota bacterium]
MNGGGKERQGGKCLGIVAILLASAIAGPAFCQTPAYERDRSTRRVAKGGETAVITVDGQWIDSRKQLRTDVIQQDGWRLESGCDGDCPFRTLDGSLYEPMTPIIASPSGTTYSVHHQVGADIDGAGPDPVTCFPIYHFNLPGAPDDIVTFDGNIEAIRTDLFLTIPTVGESDTGQPSGNRLIRITTNSAPGTDLFPGGIAFEGVLLTDACFTIGLDDLLSWEGMDVVSAASITFFTNGQISQGPFDVTSFLPSPWNGFVSIRLPDGSGLGINGVQLDILIEKSVTVPNDDCANPIPIGNGTHTFSTLGATTDGPEEPTACAFSGYSDIGSDIWYTYAATCTGTLTVNLCNATFDTKVAVYDGFGRCPPTIAPIGCDDDGCGALRSLLTIPASAGHSYVIRVGGYQGFQGTGLISLSCDEAGAPEGACCIGSSCAGTFTEPDCTALAGSWHQGQTCPAFACPIFPPPNDACGSCVSISTGTTVVGTTVAATGTDVTSCGTSDTKDVWLCWTAECTGRAAIETCGSPFDTTLAVFDACGGTQLACNDDSCGVASKLELNVVEGTNYKIRIAGHAGTVGNYLVNIRKCKNACCVTPGTPGSLFGCALAAPDVCTQNSGTPLGPGSLCLGDANGSGVDDACEACPAATLNSADPPNRTVDARQPYAADAPLPRQGIGSPGEPGSVREAIRVLLIPRLAGAEHCFELCETSADPTLGANNIQTTTYQGNGIYELVLDHAVPAGQATTISYRGDGSFVEYRPHPANVNGDVQANATDVQKLIDCCLRNSCIVPWGARSCDIDRSNLVSPLDILTEIGLLIGADAWMPWNGTARPTGGTTCPLP